MGNFPHFDNRQKKAWGHGGEQAARVLSSLLYCTSVFNIEYLLLGNWKWFAIYFSATQAQRSFVLSYPALSFN
jgi:hypothetical protein